MRRFEDNQGRQKKKRREHEEDIQLCDLLFLFENLVTEVPKDQDVRRQANAEVKGEGIFWG
jgi:hypothetical protein